MFDPDLAPIPGRSRLGLVAFAVFLGLSVCGLVATGIASFFNPDLGLTLIGLTVAVVISAAGFVYALIVRRNYLRDVRNGAIVERRLWSGADLLPPLS